MLFVIEQKKRTRKVCMTIKWFHTPRVFDDLRVVCRFLFLLSNVFDYTKTEIKKKPILTEQNTKQPKHSELQTNGVQFSKIDMRNETDERW